MGKVFWVNNVTGDDVFNGRTAETAFETVSQGGNDFDTYGEPGDILRIVYTGVDYTYSALPYFDSHQMAGSGWGEGQFLTVEGYDPSGGINRPKLICRGGSANAYFFAVSTHANFILFKDLWFYKTHLSTNNGSGAILISNGLLDNRTYFKFEKCIFEGQYSDTGYDKAAYVVGGSEVTIYSKNCLYKNLAYSLFVTTATPRICGVVFENNIFWNQNRGLTKQLYMSEDASHQLDYTYANNTTIVAGPSKYYGYTTYMVSGNFGSTDNFVFKNNFAFYNNRILYTSAATVSTDHTSTVGYNTVGGIGQGVTTLYSSTPFDIFETEANYSSVGDKNTSLLQSDYTNLFVGYADFTYLWPETGWILAPDLRPISADMTGTMEDPLNGLRGAIQHTGVHTAGTYDSTHTCTILDQTGALYTNHEAFIDRTEYFSGTGSLLFWDSSDVSEVADTTTIENAYDKEPHSTYGVLPAQSSGNLHILRQAPIAYGGIKGNIHIDMTGFHGHISTPINIYLDNTSGDTGPVLLGSPLYTQAVQTRKRLQYAIPDELMLEISDASFSGTRLLFNNVTPNAATYGILDTYMTFLSTSSSSMDTSHTAGVADSTTPYVWKGFSTTHKATIKRGKIYLIDYYIPGNWWGFTNKEVYTYEDWNNYENIVQYMARFFHSPIYFNTQLPDFGTIKFVANANGTFSLLEDYYGAQVPTAFSKYIGGNSSHGFSVSPWISNILKLSSTVINPDIFTDDGTTYKLEVFVSDNTIATHIRYDGGGLYNFWIGDRAHPFATDHTFYLSFYGKKD